MENFKKFIVEYRKELLVGLVVLFAIIFMVLNYQAVEFWFFGTMHVPLILLLLLFLIIGGLAVGVYYYIKNRDQRAEIKFLKKQLEEKSAPQEIPETTDSKEETEE